MFIFFWLCSLFHHWLHSGCYACEVNLSKRLIIEHLLTVKQLFAYIQREFEGNVGLVYLLTKALSYTHCWIWKKSWYHIAPLTVARSWGLFFFFLCWCSLFHHWLTFGCLCLRKATHYWVLSHTKAIFAYVQREFKGNVGLVYLKSCLCHVLILVCSNAQHCIVSLTEAH